jgi:lipoyl(octanoyl) transferase
MEAAWLLDLGLREYRDVWALQHRLVEQRIRDEIPDVCIFVEHPHAITLGRKSPKRSPIRTPQVEIPVYEIERGGEATYHGPGQLVGYPILKLEGERRDLHRYLRDLERALIDVLGDFGISAGRRPGATGVWTPEGKKIASIGVAVRRWVTYHGFALNVNTDLRYFRLISPCGFDGSVMTSMGRELGRDVPMEVVRERTAARLEERFARKLQLITLDRLMSCA